MFSFVGRLFSKLSVSYQRNIKYVQLAVIHILTKVGKTDDVFILFKNTSKNKKVQ